MTRLNEQNMTRLNEQNLNEQNLNEQNMTEQNLTTNKKKFIENIFNCCYVLPNFTIPPMVGQQSPPPFYSITWKYAPPLLNSTNIDPIFIENKSNIINPTFIENKPNIIKQQSFIRDFMLLLMYY
jgi:hypothetical protein